MIEEKFEFRNIRRDEALQTAEIERICFPPKRGLLRENDGGTCEQGAGIFSGGCGQGDRKDRRFFSTVSRQMNPLFGMSFLQTPGCMIHRGRQSCCWGLTCSRNTAGRVLRQN